MQRRGSRQESKTISEKSSINKANSVNLENTKLYSLYEEKVYVVKHSFKHTIWARKVFVAL